MRGNHVRSYLREVPLLHSGMRVDFVSKRAVWVLRECRGKKAVEKHEEEEVKHEEETPVEPAKQEEASTNETWKEVRDAKTGKVYYWNKTTNETKWTKPDGNLLHARSFYHIFFRDFYHPAKCDLILKMHPNNLPSCRLCLLTLL